MGFSMAIRSIGASEEPERSRAHVAADRLQSWRQSAARRKPPGRCMADGQSSDPTPKSFGIERSAHHLGCGAGYRLPKEAGHTTTLPSQRLRMRAEPPPKIHRRQVRASPFSPFRWMRGGWVVVCPFAARVFPLVHVVSAVSADFGINLDFGPQKALEAMGAEVTLIHFPSPVLVRV